MLCPDIHTYVSHTYALAYVRRSDVLVCMRIRYVCDTYVCMSGHTYALAQHVCSGICASL
jgi:hypothetical protein